MKDFKSTKKFDINISSIDHINSADAIRNLMYIVRESENIKLFYKTLLETIESEKCSFVLPDTFTDSEIYYLIEWKGFKMNKTSDFSIEFSLW